jgi:hypothetical protein
MAVSVTTLGTATNTTGAAAIMTLGASVPAGATLIACCGVRQPSSGTGTMSASKAQPWSLLAGVNLGSGYGRGVGFYAANVSAMSAGDTITWTPPAAGQGTALALCYATGLTSAPDAGVTATAQSGATSKGCPVTSGVPSTTGEFFIACCVVAGGHGALTQDTANWANPPDRATSGTGTSDIDVVPRSKVSAGGAAQGYSTTWATGASGCAWIAAFKLATGGSKGRRTLATLGTRTGSRQMRIS